MQIQLAPLRLGANIETQQQPKQPKQPKEPKQPKQQQPKEPKHAKQPKQQQPSNPKQPVKPAEKPKWWEATTACDPITLEPLSELAYPPFELKTKPNSRAVQVDSIKTRVESAFGFSA